MENEPLRLNRLSEIYLVLSGVGIGLSIYIAYEYLTQSFQGCNINPEISCAGVFQSGHTSIFGIPFYVLGLAWFALVLAIGLVTSKAAKKPVNGEILLPLLMVGNVFTVYLWYLELSVIGIICPLCTGSYIVNYALTGTVFRSIV